MRSLFDSLHSPSSFNPMSRRPPGRGGRSGGGLWFLVCLAAGLLQAFSLAWPLADWHLPGTVPGQPSGGWQIVSLALLVLALQFSGRVGQSVWRGWVFATAWLCGTFWWLFVSMNTYGGLPAWMAVLAVGALGGALALYYAVAAGVLAALAPVSRAGQAFMFAALWTLAELARGKLFTGFPWGAAGYAHVDLMPFWAPLVGVYGMGFLAALLAYVLASVVSGAWRTAAAWLLSPVSRPPRTGTPGSRIPQPAAQLQPRWPWSGASWADGLRNGLLLLLIGGLLSTLGSSPAWRQPDAGTTAAGELPVWLLQGNIPQDQKFQPGTGMAQALSWYPQQIAQAAARRADQPLLVVAPETALPLLPSQLGEGFWAPLMASLGAQQGAGAAAAMLGLPLGDRQGYTNSAWGISPAAARAAGGRPADAGALIYRYDKHHLVPFGEFVPPMFRWFTDLMNIPLGDFQRGPLAQVPWSWGGQRLAANICYEDLFGEELAAGFRDPATAPTVLVNLSNIAWFGDTVAIDQHLQISRLRAMELGRPMLRATNTGATAVVDHRGVVTAQLPRLERARLEAVVQGRDGLTPFARWAGTWGLMPLGLVCGALVLLLGALRHLGRRGGRTRRR